MQISGVKLIFGGKVSGDAYDITYENGEIISISKTPVFLGNYVTLPYSDIHIHGAMGYDVSELSLDALNKISLYLKDNGIGYFCPTLMASPLQKLSEKFTKLRKIKDDVLGAKILGVHIEGPYISVAKHGAQPIENIVTSYEKQEDKFFIENSDILRIVTMCPHTKNSTALVKTLVKNNIKVEAGHDDSIDEEIISCMNEGLDGVTHIYCASSGVRRRDGNEKHLGLNECGLLFDKLYVECIFDKIHISPLLFSLIYKSKGFEKIMLVSDALSPTGMGKGEYILGDDTKIMSDGDVAYLLDKSALAGSTTNVAKMVENVVELGIPLPEAVYMASETPIKYINYNYSNVGIHTKHFNIVDEKGKLLKAF